MKPIGSDGEPIPLPPDDTSIGGHVAGFMSAALSVGGTLFIIPVIQIMFAYKTIIAAGWMELLRRLLFGLGVALAGGLLLVATLMILGFLLRPLGRSDDGRALERRIARLGPIERFKLVEEARLKRDRARSARARKEWSDWLDWLQSREAPKPIVEGPSTWTIRPARGALILMGAVGTFLGGVGLGGLIVTILGEDRSLLGLLSAPFLIALGAYTYAEVGTNKIELTPSTLRFRRYWRVKWSVPRDRTVVVLDQGEFPPVYRVFDRATEKEVGEIIAPQFPSEALEKLADLFPYRT